MSKLGAITLIAIGALAMVIGAPGVYLALYAYANVNVLSRGSFLVTVGGVAIAAAVGIIAAYSADPSRSRFPAWALSLVILAGSVLAVGYDTVNRMQLERTITDQQKAQDVLRQDNVALVAENARIKKAAQTTYAEARALDRGSSAALAAIQRVAASAGLINQKTLNVAAQANSLQSSALAALLRLEQHRRTTKSCPR
jgi:cell division protein FtsB